jgi:hypothetical protein
MPSPAYPASRSRPIVRRVAPLPLPHPSWRGVGDGAVRPPISASDFWQRLGI